MIIKKLRGFICRDNDNIIKPCYKGFCSFDIETHTYYKNKRLSSEEVLKSLTYNEKNLSDDFFKDFEIKPWSYQVYDKNNGFFACSDIEDLIDYLKDIKAHTIWDFNLKYDGGVFLYDLLQRKKFKLKKDVKIASSVDHANYYHISFYFYKDCFGVDFYDFHNIINSSLKNLSSMFGIEETKGKMDYFKTDFENLTESDFNYLRNDVVILYNAVEKYNEQLKQINGVDCLFSLIDEGRKFMTAGSIAKYSLLKYFFPDIKTHKLRIKKYHQDHPFHSSKSFYNKYKSLHLYRGGITCVNCYYQGQKIINNFYAYDVNSEYPAVMYEAYDLAGKEKTYKPNEYNQITKNEEIIIVFNYLYFKTKDNCFPIFAYKNDYPKEFEIKEDFAIYEFEFEKLKLFYNIEFKIKEYITFKKYKQKYKEFIKVNYKIKQETKNKTEKQVAKIFLNSSYGKLGQKIEREKFELYNTPELVTFKRTEEKTSDVNAGMSIINGAYITARARCMLMDYIMKIGEGNPRKNVYYCDTDSVFTSKELKEVGNELGQMKCDKIASHGIFLAPKTYGFSNNENNFIMCKGLNKLDMAKFFYNLNREDFYKNFYYSHEFFVKSTKMVKGGRLIFWRWKNLVKPYWIE